MKPNGSSAESGITPHVSSTSTPYGSRRNGAVSPQQSSAAIHNTIRITPQARYYAVSELARRAGVPAEFFRTWAVSSTDDRTVIEISNGVQKQITFWHAPGGLLDDIGKERFCTARACWMGDLGGFGACRTPDLIVPYVGDGSPGNPPLFRVIDSDHIECRVDLLASVLLTLSRWEETQDVPRDEHGRFPAASSIAWRDQCLGRPIVDECGLAFEQVLEHLFPTWTKSERKLRIKLSHDVDHIGLPFRWKNVFRHAARYRTPLNSGRDLLSLVGGVEPTELRAVREIVLLSRRYGFRSAVYWKASPPGPRDSGYDLREPVVRRVIEWLSERGVELGVHPGYATYRSPEKLRREIHILKRVLGNQPLGGRQHYLRWRPRTWIDWENCGLAYDSSVGYAEHVGFRAGTCVPYRPWLFPLNRQADLFEIPLLVMDRTLLGYMKLSQEKARETVKDLLDRCRAVGGVLTIVWHNNSLLDPPYRGLYLSLLETFRGIENYDWASEASAWPILNGLCRVRPTSLAI
jgi:Family of unknown function (DUF7033)